MSAFQDNGAGSHRRREAGKQVSVIKDAISRHLLSSYCGLSTVRKVSVHVFREFLARWRRGVLGELLQKTGALRAVTTQWHSPCLFVRMQFAVIKLTLNWSHCVTRPPPSQLRTC